MAERTVVRRQDRARSLRKTTGTEGPQTIGRRPVLSHLQVADVQRLQRQAGNRAVTVLLQRDKGPAAAGGSALGKAERSFRLGEKVFRRGDFGHAYDYFKRADQYHHLPEISFSMAQCLWHMGGRNVEAIALYRVYIAEVPNGSRVKDAAEAIAELGSAISTGDEQSDRTIAEKSFRLGESLYRKRRFAAAAHQFAKAYKLLPAAEIAFSQAQSLRRAGIEPEKALELFELYVREQPSGPRVKDAKDFIAELKDPKSTGDPKTDLPVAEKLYRRAEASYMQKRFSRAYVLFTKSDDLLHLPENHFNRAQALRNIGGRTEESIRLFERYIDEQPNGPRVAHARAHIADMREFGASL